MSDDTPRLNLPLLAQMQEMDAATLNEAMVRIDALCGPSLKGRFVNTPPAAPADGDAYLTGAAPTGAWSGQAYKIAWCIDGGWRFQIPFNGYTAFVESESTPIVYRDGAWTALGALIAGAEVSIASAATCDLGAAGALCVAVTGAATITGFGATPNALRLVRFAQGLTLTHNAVSLALLGGASRAAAAGDCGIYVSDAGGNWRELAYFRAGADPGDLATRSGAETLANKTLLNPAAGNGSGAASLSVNGAAGQNRDIVFQSGGAPRWYLRATASAESGSNNGTNIVLTAMADDGATTVGNAFTITRANLAVSFGGNILPAADNAKSLGSAVQRFATVYAATGAINTSDAERKQDVRPLSQAEIAVARRLAACVRLFRFRDAVALKGEAARLHAGPLAQEVEAAFAAEGLDARRYGLFCADDDEAGGEVLGVRPDELAQFVIAGLAARLAALEAA